MARAVGVFPGTVYYEIGVDYETCKDVCADYTPYDGVCIHKRMCIAIQLPIQEKDGDKNDQ